jgi:hypothetical protein
MCNAINEHFRVFHKEFYVLCSQNIKGGRLRMHNKTQGLYDQVSHPHKTDGSVRVLYITFTTLSTADEEKNNSEPMAAISTDLSLL